MENSAEGEISAGHEDGPVGFLFGLGEFALVENVLDDFENVHGGAESLDDEDESHEKSLFGLGHVGEDALDESFEGVVHVRGDLGSEVS